MSVSPSDCTLITSCDPPRGNTHEKDYERAAVRLVRSLRRRGGACAEMPVLCVHERPCRVGVVEELQRLGCEVRHVVAPSQKFSASIIGAAAASEIKTGFGLWLDSDIFLIGDPSEILDTTADVRAAPTTHSHHRWVRPEDDADFSLMLAALGVSESIRRAPDGAHRELRTTIDGTMARFYTSCGAVLFRRASGVAALWNDYMTRIAAAVESGKLPLRCADAIGEPTLTLAILARMKAGVEFEPLPERLHYVSALRGALAADTRLIHYQENRVGGVPDDEWEVVLP